MGRHVGMVPKLTSFIQIPMNILFLYLWRKNALQPDVRFIFNSSRASRFFEKLFIEQSSEFNYIVVLSRNDLYTFTWHWWENQQIRSFFFLQLGWCRTFASFIVDALKKENFVFSTMCTVWYEKKYSIFRLFFLPSHSVSINVVNSIILIDFYLFRQSSNCRKLNEFYPTQANLVEA